MDNLDQKTADLKEIIAPIDVPDAYIAGRENSIESNSDMVKFKRDHSIQISSKMIKFDRMMHATNNGHSNQNTRSTESLDGILDLNRRARRRRRGQPIKGMIPGELADLKKMTQPEDAADGNDAENSDDFIQKDKSIGKAKAGDIKHREQPSNDVPIAISDTPDDIKTTSDKKKIEKMIWQDCYMYEIELLADTIATIKLN